MLTQWTLDPGVQWNASRLPSSNDVLGRVWHAEAICRSDIPNADQPEEYDPSRLPPRIFLLRKEARASIEKEVRDLLHIPSDGIPALKLVHRQSMEVRGLPFARPTLIVRIKSTGVYKARLCLRGDLIGGESGKFFVVSNDTSFFTTDGSILYHASPSIPFYDGCDASFPPTRPTSGKG